MNKICEYLLLVSKLKLIVLLKNILLDRKTFLFATILWVIFQFVWNSHFQYDEWISDSGLYQYYAKQCYEAGTMYPNMQFYHYEYIHNPGWVNVLILWYAVFHSFSGVIYLIIIFNLLSFLLLRSVAMEISGNRSFRYLVMYLYMLLPAFSTTFTFYWSEPLYIFLTLLSYYCTLKHSYAYLFVGGVCLALAFWVRPVAIASAISSAIFILLYYKSFKRLSIYLGGCTCISMLIAWTTHQNFPNYLCSATTGGVNLIMASHDNATGQWDGSVRINQGGYGYLPGLWSDDKYKPVYMYFDRDELIKDYEDTYTYREVDSIYKKRSMMWIQANPLKYIRLFPHKIKILFSGSANMWAPANKGCLRLREFFRIYQSWLVIVLTFFSFIGVFWIGFYKNPKLIYLILTFILYTGITLVSVVDPRFNWAFLPYIILLSSFVITEIFKCFSIYINERSSNDLISN